MTMSYDEAAMVAWAPLDPVGGMRELVRYATLAPNSHNSQPWIFSAKPQQLTIAPDASRRCPAVDPDDHHLYASLGCAAENIVHAAAAMGLRATPSFENDAVVIVLEPAPPARSSLFEAITQRQSTRATYDGRPVPAEGLKALEQAGGIGGVATILITDRTQMTAVTAYVVEGNTAQMRDRAFMNELKSWMRFNGADAAATMDGLYAAASGNPSLPAWLARLLLPFVFTERGENDKYREHIATSAGIAVFAAERDDKAHWVEAGRACQRFCLQATALGLKTAFINPPVEVPDLRRQFASHLGIGDRRPNLIVRFGYGPTLPRSLRRPVEQVLR